MRFFILAGALLASTEAQADSILFVGNSFTFGANSPVREWRPDSVTDLNREGIGGVPALFKRFAAESGLRYDVSLETSPGRTLQWHLDEKRTLLDRRWDTVVLQQYSTLDPERPGDPTSLISSSVKLARMFRARNPKVKMALVATWSRPDQTYPPGMHWSGQPIERMALDIRRADERAARAARIGKVVPVGEAFNCAIASGIADPNPYDGIASGLTDLWADDHYHASTAGYYLEALTIFAKMTGHDPRRLGRGETAAKELAIAPALAAQLQRVAYDVALRGRCRA
jgi:hypothetical protein